MTKTVLLIDDERDIVDLVKYNLEREGYAVLTARTGNQALQQVQHRPHLILLDVMMPELDGWEVIKHLKKDPRTAEIPVIFLTAKGSDVDEVLGLELRADDYIVKPISIPKLIARIKNTLRKYEPRDRPEETPPPVTIGGIEIIPQRHTVRVNGKETFFPKKEFEVPYYLSKHEGRLVNRKTLLQAVWGTDVHVVDRTVDVHIRKIRDKPGTCAHYIETIKGVGYRMREEGDNLR